MNNLRAIALFMILGKPLVVYLGIIVLIGFLITATIGMLILKGKTIPLKYHFLLAKISIALAVIHGLLAYSLSAR